jgi:antitoxin component YwqK of YwqJK toxin-antitoxin module
MPDPPAGNHSDKEIVHGKKYNWYKDGKPCGYRTYSNGVLSGAALILSPNGDKRTYTFRDGAENGPAKAWYADGQKMYEMTFTNGKGNGTCESWSRDGKYHGQGEYRNDKPYNGTFVEISQFSTFSNGTMVLSETIPKDSR